jgi:aerotaxis receptor
VADGDRRVADARDRMTAVLAEVMGVNGTLAGIRQSAHEQQQGIGQINEAVAHMDSITQQNAAMVEQLAAAAQSLNGQVEAVDSSLRLFRLAADETTVAEVDAVALRRSGKASRSGQAVRN